MLSLDEGKNYMIMTAEQSFFIKLLRDHLHGTSSNKESDVNWDVILKYGKLHDLLPIIHYQCKTFNTIGRDEYIYQVSCYVHLNAEKKRIESAFQSLNYAFEKGIVIADFYPISALRSMGDIDVLLTDECLQQGVSILNQNDYTFKQDAGDEKQFVNNGILIEIHSRPMHNSIGNDRFVNFFSDWEKYIENHRLADNYHVLFLFVHLRQHLVSSGVGFRQFMDIAVITQKLELDWIWILNKGKQIGIDEFIKKVLAFNERWFDIKSPFSVTIDEDFFDTATVSIFENGVFGTNNTDNDMNSIPRLAANKNISLRKAKYTYYWTLIFPSYDGILKSSWCPAYLVDRRWLLPIAWIHRITKKMFRKNAIWDTMKHINKSSMESDLRLNYFAKWGL